MAIYETGVGGKNDVTNVIKMPVVTGITGLGIDHEKTLKVAPQIRPTYFTLGIKEGREEGATIEEIAWHKFEIFKPECSAFFILQQSHAENILRRRVEKKGVSFTFVNIRSELLNMKFSASIQRKNVALTVALTNTFLNRNVKTTCVDYGRVSKKVLCGLKSASLSERCQLLKEGSRE